jgi:predicted AlkP superfamily phosphohydrolase/phosphomutase
MRMLVVGLDGATFDLIRPWAAAGQLPNLARLMQEGVHGELRSTLPPVTSPAWPSFMTGMNPGQHGVFDFIRSRRGDGPGGFDMVNASHIAAKTLWQRLSEAGRRVGVVAVPVTYPPRPVNGFMVSGILSPRHAEIAYPPGLLKRYEDELGPYRISPDVQYKDGDEEAFVADLLALMEQRARYALRLMQDHEWDFFMVHFVALDAAQHALWKFVDPSSPPRLGGTEGGPRYDPHSEVETAAAQRYGRFRQAQPKSLLTLYQKADAILARLWEQIGPDDVLLVMSDHGFGPLHGTVNLNNFLLQRGFLHLKRDVATRLRYALFRHGITPSAAYALLVKLGLQDVVVKVSKRARNAMVGRFLSFSAVDWSRTQAYAMGHVGQVFINLRGRQPQGCVPPEEYAAVRQRVADALRELKHPQSDRPLVDEIIFKEQVYEGPYAERGADLLPVMDGFGHIAFPLFASNAQIVTPQVRGDSGCHRLHGILLASGPAVRRGIELNGAQITDLAPTILYRMGLPVPDDMDGRVLTEMFEPAFARATPLQRAEAEAGERRPEHELPPEERAEIEARLRSLGYLE